MPHFSPPLRKWPLQPYFVELIYEKHLEFTVLGLRSESLWGINDLYGICVLKGPNLEIPVSISQELQWTYMEKESPSFLSLSFLVSGPLSPARAYWPWVRTSTCRRCEASTPAQVAGVGGPTSPSSPKNQQELPSLHGVHLTWPRRAL